MHSGSASSLRGNKRLEMVEKPKDREKQGNVCTWAIASWPQIHEELPNIHLEDPLVYVKMYPSI